MPETDIDPLLSYRHTPQFLIVLALYEQLHDAFCQEFGAQAVPEYAVDDVGQRVPDFLQLAHNPGLLLPAHDGWCYSPEWVAPLRLNEMLLNLLPDLEDAEGVTMFAMEAFPVNSESVMELPVIERRIYGRAWTLGLLRSADHILDHAIERSRRDVAQATGDYEASIRLLASTLGAGEFRAGQLDTYRSEVRLRLHRLRLHWLELWSVVEIERKKKARGRKTSRVSQLQSTIKPQDVYDAYETIEMHLRQQDKTVLRLLEQATATVNDLVVKYEQTGRTDKLPSILRAELEQVRPQRTELSSDERTIRVNWALGQWYRNTLVKCGASEEDLQAIQVRPARGEIKPNPQGWHHVVRKIISNHIQSLS